MKWRGPESIITERSARLDRRNEKRGKKERVSDLREIGKEWRYPELARSRRELDEWRHEIRRAFGVAASVNQDLELDSVECTFRKHKARRDSGIVTLIRGR